MNVLSTACTNYFIYAIFNNEELSSIEHHADVRIGEVILFISTSSPGDFWEFAGLHISKEKSAASWSYKISVLIDIYLWDFMALSRFQNDTLAVFNSFNDHLWKWYISKFELALVLLLFEANIENINWTAKRADANLWAIRFPSNGSDRIIVFNLLAANFIPLRSLGIEIVNIEAVKVSYNGCFTSGIECCAGEFLYTLILGIVKSLEAISSLFVEVYLSIIASSQDVWAPG